MRLARMLLILVGLYQSQQVWAQASAALGTETSDDDLKWLKPEAAQAAAQPPKVRIGLRLTPYEKVITKSQKGAADARYVPLEPMRHTLRARLNQTNHFYFGSYHVETVPRRWVKQTHRYDVGLNLYRRYGEFGQLEESLGTLELTGTLEAGADNIHVLIGSASVRFRDKSGKPLLDVAAGFAPNGEPTAVAPAVSNLGAPANNVAPTGAARPL